MTATRTKRILSVQPVCDGGGSEHALIRMFRQLAAAGWECHVAVPAPARLAPQYAAAGATVHVVRMARLTTSGGPGRWIGFAARWPLTVLLLWRLARRLDVPVVHSNSLHCWTGWAAAWLARRPHVWHAREIVFQSRAALRFERWMCRHFAVRVIAISRAVAAQLDPANVVVLVDGADPAIFRPDRAGSFRAAHGIDDAVVVVGSVARIDTWKGFDVLLDAVPALQAARPGVEVVIAGGAVEGKEGYESALRARAALIPGVHWLGWQPDPGAVMADLDVFAQVSTAPEPFGLVVVEALACGVPVVAGDEGGPAEILGSVPAGAGRLVAPGDPAALAAAAVDLLPPGPSSARRRRSRASLAPAVSGDFVGLFDEVAASCRAPRRSGTASAVPRRTPSS